MNSTFYILLLFVVSISATLSVAARPEPEVKESKKGGGNDYGGMGGFGPGDGFNIPGLGPVVGGGYGAGYGGPTGGRSKSGTVRNSVVCKDKGPCYKKKLICPAKCFTSYGHAGKGYGYGGGGGSCTIDCQKKCTAYC